MSNLSPSRAQKAVSTVKVLYFLVFAGIGIFTSFINIYYRSINLSGTQIGLINMVSPLVGIFSSIAGGMLSDRFGKNRRIFIIACLGIIISIIGLRYVQSFPLILLASSGIGLFISPIVSLLDSVTLRLLGERRERYGIYRVWGTLGFIVTSSTFGYLIDQFGFTVIFTGYAVVFGLFILSAWGLPNLPVVKNPVVLSGMGEIVRRPAWILFALAVFITWFASTGIAVFFNIYLKDIGSSDQLVGITNAAAAVAELPIFPFSAYFLRRLGASRLLAVGMFGFILRFICISLLTDPAWGPAVNMLNAVSYVPFYMGAVAYASDVAPDHLKATSQGMLYAVLNLANVLGALISGWLSDLVGLIPMYQLLAGCAFAAFCLFVGGQVILKKKQQLALGAD